MTGPATESFRGSFESATSERLILSAEVISLGCRLNLSESEELRACWRARTRWWSSTAAR
jgi:hypothetical protein